MHKDFLFFKTITQNIKAQTVYISFDVLYQFYTLIQMVSFTRDLF